MSNSKATGNWGGMGTADSLLLCFGECSPGSAILPDFQTRGRICVIKDLHKISPSSTEHFCE